MIEVAVELKSSSLQPRNNISLTARLVHGRLAARLTAKIASYPTLYYVVVTAVRRTKHSDAKLLRVSHGNKKRARHNAASGVEKKNSMNLITRLHLLSDSR